LRDCVAEGLRLIFTPIGVEDDKETHDDEGACRAGRERYPACDAQVAFVRGEYPDRFVWPLWRRQHCRALPQGRDRPQPILQLVEGIARGRQEAAGR